MFVEKFIIDKRCDEPMRRSKEKLNTPYHRPWKCTGKCASCVCCIATLSDGTEQHINLMGKQLREQL